MCLHDGRQRGQASWLLGVLHTTFDFCGLASVLGVDDVTVVMFGKFFWANSCSTTCDSPSVSYACNSPALVYAALHHAGFQTHTTPVLMNAGERAELGSEKYIPLSPILEGTVILKPNPDYVELQE